MLLWENLNFHGYEHIEWTLNINSFDLNALKMKFILDCLTHAYHCIGRGGYSYRFEFQNLDNPEHKIYKYRICSLLTVPYSLISIKYEALNMWNTFMTDIADYKIYGDLIISCIHTINVCFVLISTYYTFIRILFIHFFWGCRQYDISDRTKNEEGASNRST